MAVSLRSIISISLPFRRWTISGKPLEVSFLVSVLGSKLLNVQKIILLRPFVPRNLFWTPFSRILLQDCSKLIWLQLKLVKKNEIVMEYLVKFQRMDGIFYKTMNFRVACQALQDYYQLELYHQWLRSDTRTTSLRGVYKVKNLSRNPERSTNWSYNISGEGLTQEQPHLGWCTRW